MVKLVIQNGATWNGYKNGDRLDLDTAREVITGILRLDTPEDLIEMPTCDGGRVCCYASSEDMNEDTDGAYAPGWEHETGGYCDETAHYRCEL
jgi:hypothetical protein